MEDARCATLDDLDRLTELLSQAYAAATSELRGASLYGHPERSITPRERLEATITSDDFAVLCGTVNDYVAGLAIVGVRTLTENRVGVVEELYVDPEMREIGVGESLLDAATQWCRSQQCVGVDMTALPGDRGTKNLCERSGYTARLLVMHRSL